MNGWLNVDKPEGMTSRDVINSLQKKLPRQIKIGHTGTLDPLATGVLVVSVGAATRLASLVQDMPKSYHARVRFGATSDTDDADGKIQVLTNATPPSFHNVTDVIDRFIGIIQQRPPQYSAIKTAGQRSYQLARSGHTLVLAERSVRVDAIHVLGYDWPFLDLEIDCGKGTYIRSLARDIGATLGVGGYVESLRRTRIGPFHVNQGHSLNQCLAEGLSDLMWPLDAVLADWPRVIISGDCAVRIRFGQRVTIQMSPGRAALYEGNTLVSIGMVSDQGLFTPSIVFPRISEK